MNPGTGGDPWADGASKLGVGDGHVPVDWVNGARNGAEHGRIRQNQLDFFRVKAERIGNQTPTFSTFH